MSSRTPSAAATPSGWRNSFETFGQAGRRTRWPPAAPYGYDPLSEGRAEFLERGNPRRRGEAA